MSDLVTQARELARSAGNDVHPAVFVRGRPVERLSEAVIALADAFESHIALHPGSHDEPTEESAAQRFAAAVTDILVDFGCAAEVDGLNLESQTEWLRARLVELAAARHAVEVLRTCVRDDIVVLEAADAVNAYDAARAPRKPAAEGQG